MVTEMAVHVPTPKDFIDVIEWAFNHDKQWRNGSRDLNKDYWLVYRTSTCIDIKDSELGYCSREWAINYGMTVVGMEKFNRYIKSYVNEFGKKYGLE